MSFFGFDPSLPREKPTGGERGFFEHSNPFNDIQKGRKLQAFQDTEEEVIDFEDTYDGLGDQLDEAGDDLNDDTFGGGAAQDAVGKDFDFFGNTAQVSNAIDEEHMRYNLQHHRSPAPQPAPKPKKTGYEKYQDPGYIPEIEAKSSLWGSKAQQQPPLQQQATDGRISTARSTTRPPQHAQQGPPLSAQPVQMLSLEEIEAQMLAQAQPHHPPPFPHQQPPYQFSQQFQPPLPPTQSYEQVAAPAAPRQHQQGPLPPTTAAAQSRQSSQPQPQQTRAAQQPLQILQNPNRPRHSPQPSLERADPQQGAQSAPIPVITHPQQLMELSEEQRRTYLEEDAKRAKRNHKIFLLSKGNGLMTPQDKNFITRIQLQQLVTATGNSADPTPEAALTEDFYYQVYSQIRGAPRQHPTQPLGHFAQTYLFQTGNRTGGGNRRQQINGDNHMQRMQQQVQRAVEAAKLKPKNKQLIIEGSLGKISFSNAKTPKPLLNIKRPEVSEARPTNGKKPANVSSSDRKTILRNIENVYSTLMALEDAERRMPPPPVEGNADSIQAHISWRQEITALNTRLWSELKVLDPIVPGSLVTHPFIALLSFSKGKKAMPRVFHQIDQEQRVTILTMIVVHLDQLDVIRLAHPAPGETQPPAQVRDEIELFSQAVMPCLLGYVSEAPINIIAGLLGLLIDHSSVSNIATTKIGLGMLTMLLSRAELVKESGGANDDEWSHWAGLYDRLFDVLEPILPSLFPSPVNTGDDVYVWQFLAAVGIGASPEQQQRLVIGVKDRVMETVAVSKGLPSEMRAQRLGNVNLFMRAIGLDVEMLG